VALITAVVQDVRIRRSRLHGDFICASYSGHCPVTSAHREAGKSISHKETHMGSTRNKLAALLIGLGLLGGGGVAAEVAASPIGAPSISQIADQATPGATPGGADQQCLDEQNENGEKDAEGDTDNVQDENGKDDAGEASEKGENEGSDKPVTGGAASRAKTAAVAETGGKPGDVERASEKGASYEVEVIKTNGNQADVLLDDRYKVIEVAEDNEQDEAGEKEATTSR